MTADINVGYFLFLSIGLYWFDVKVFIFAFINTVCFTGGQTPTWEPTYFGYSRAFVSWSINSSDLYYKQTPVQQAENEYSPHETVFFHCEAYFKFLWGVSKENKLCFAQKLGLLLCSSQMNIYLKIWSIENSCEILIWTVPFCSVSILGTAVCFFFCTWKQALHYFDITHCK